MVIILPDKFITSTFDCAFVLSSRWPSFFASSIKFIVSRTLKIVPVYNLFSFWENSILSGEPENYGGKSTGKVEALDEVKAEGLITGNSV
jgi:hypothetical protein